MKVVVLYHPVSDHASAVDVFCHEIEARYKTKPVVVSLDTREGADMAKLYDITHYPAVLAHDEEGKLLQVWQDEFLPLISDVSYYLQDSFSSHRL